MTTFNSFSNTLPDPTIAITDAGNIDSSGAYGPGFSGVNFRENASSQVSRTNSGRGIHRQQENHYWSFDIKYHPMTRDDFDVIDSFLSTRNSRLNPFFVSLPQYFKSKNTVLATYASTNDIITSSSYSPGIGNMLVSSPYPAKPGDMFNIYDPADINHLKTYKVTRVETNTLYQAGSTQPTASQIRLHFTPPLQRFTTVGAKLIFTKPKFRVMLVGDVRDYDLNTEGLYQYSMSCEEILP